MIKSIIIIATLIVNLVASNIYNTFPTTKEAFAFKKGFSLAIMSLIDGREFKIQGRMEEQIEFKNYMVIVDATDLDDADKFAIQKIGFIYASSIRLTDERIVIADFERKANAITLAKTLNRDYFNKNAPHRRAYTYEKQIDEKFYKEKSFFYEVADLIEDQLKDEMKVLVIEDKRPNLSPVKNTLSPNHKIIKPNPQMQNTTTKKIKTQVKKQNNSILEKPQKEKPIKQEKKIQSFSKTNTEPFFIQFIPKGRYITRYTLSKDVTEKDISEKDFVKENEIENSGELIISDLYIITKDKVKFYKAENGFYYKASQSEVINDFTKE